ncbi:hypothetical protein GCM10028803_18810 [Larkinella knui]|uniref:DinB family protein n=1 Tax=Larkinella knui TaxID=2025310 RepID=A0A3P1CUI8_9BACT|nr:DinB family protein [Larkinella knui]RRB16982.1 DinB family protein [Larkinella knui]
MISSLLARLQFQPDALSHLLSGLTENQIRQRPAADQWSIFENIAHLGRYQQVFLERMRIILKEDTLTFDRYVADQDPEFESWRSLPYQQVLHNLAIGRSDILHFVHPLTEKEWQRTARHPVYGTMTIEGWTEFFLLHEAHHFLTILKLAGPIRIAGSGSNQFGSNRFFH